MRKLAVVLAVMLAAFLATIGGPAYAQSYPSRTVTLVVPFPPGGGVDALARGAGLAFTDSVPAIKDFIVRRMVFGSRG